MKDFGGKSNDDSRQELGIIDGNTNRKSKTRSRNSTSSTRRKTISNFSICSSDVVRDTYGVNFYRPKGFGYIYFARLRNVRVKVREINLSNISTFMLNEIPDEVNFWRNVNINGIDRLICLSQLEGKLL